MPPKLSGLVAAIVKNGGVKRLSAMNRLLGFIAVKTAGSEIISLHNDLGLILEEYHKKWPYYDYGEGYFYQSYEPLLIHGLRNTAFRFKLYKLNSLLKTNMAVLDVGCNTGFLSIMAAKHCGHVDAFDNNPFLIRIAERCREFEGLRNISFLCSTFDEFNATSAYDLALFLANHHTFDGNMRPEFRSCMKKIRENMKTGGHLIFESHPGEYRTHFLRRHLDSLHGIFKINSEIVVSTRKSAYDTDRLVAWMEAV